MIVLIPNFADVFLLPPGFECSPFSHPSLPTHRSYPQCLNASMFEAWESNTPKSSRLGMTLPDFLPQADRSHPSGNVPSQKEIIIVQRILFKCEGLVSGIFPRLKHEILVALWNGSYQKFFAFNLVETWVFSAYLVAQMVVRN